MTLGGKQTHTLHGLPDSVRQAVGVALVIDSSSTILSASTPFKTTRRKAYSSGQSKSTTYGHSWPTSISGTNTRTLRRCVRDAIGGLRRLSVRAEVRLSYS